MMYSDCHYEEFMGVVFRADKFGQRPQVGAVISLYGIPRHCKCAGILHMEVYL